MGWEGRGVGKLNFREGGEVEREVLVFLQLEVGGLQVPLAGDLSVCEVSGPLEEEGWGVAVECEFFCDGEGRRRGRGGEDGVLESGFAEGGVVVGVDIECAGGWNACASVGVCVSERDGDCAVGGDEYAVHFSTERDLDAGGDGG